jgi:hypothetical protein
MKGMGAIIAKAVPPPDKLRGRKAPASEPEGDEPEGGEGDTDRDEDEAAELSAMEAFDNAKSPEERLSALKDLLAICKY